MSASREKSRRQASDNEALSKKRKALLEQQKQKKRTTAVAVTVCALVVVLAVLVALACSDFMRRNGVAAVIDGEKITVDVYEYYYRSTFSQMYNQFYSMYGEYAAYFMPQNLAYCKTTEYGEGQTWYDYLIDETAVTISSIRNYCRLAKEAGFTMDQETLDLIENTKQSVKDYAAEEGVSVNKYLASSYGKGMTYDVYCRELENSMLASSYMDYVMQSFDYSSEEKTDYYTENRNDLDSYTLRVISFNASDVEGYDETKPEETMEKIRGWYSEIEKSVKGGTEFYDAVAPYSETAGTAENDDALTTVRGSQLSTFYRDWTVDASRAEGDITFAETEDGGYVVQFVSREDNDYLTRNFRAMIYPMSVSRSYYNSEEEYQVAFDSYREFAENATAAYYAMWVENGATVEAFETACSTYEEDTGYTSEFYEQSLKNAYDNISDWLYKDERMIGDVACLYSEKLGAYCVVCYTGDGASAREVIAENELRNADYQAWDEQVELTRAENFSCKFKFWRRLVG